MTAKRFTVDSDGKYWDKLSNKYVTIDHLFYLVEKLEEENEQLKHDASVLVQANKDYRVENEQLKAINSRQKALLDELKR